MARKSARLAATVAVEYSESESDSGAEDDEEPVSLPSSGKRKAERAPVAGPSVAAPVARKRQRKVQGDKAEARNLSLFDIISKHATAIPTAAKEWVSKFKENKAECIAELMTLVVQAAGMDEVVTAEQVEGGELEDMVQLLVKQIIKEGASDPLHAKSQRNFRSNYLAFWERLLQQAHVAGTAADDYLADRLINFLIAMTCAVVRPFRLVATLTAAQLVSGWVGVMVATMEAGRTAQAQLLVEQKKKASKDMQARVKSLKATQDRCSNEESNLRSHTERVFEAIFTNRFRDVSAEIRAAVIAAIGEWICADPTNFLQDSYLKYLAWAMSDKDAEVRAAACRALLGLYAEERNKGRLHEFTCRFSPRFQEIIYDIDQGVAVLGVQLVTRLVQLEEMDASAVKDVYMLLVDDSAEVRQSVGELVVRLLEGYGTASVAQAQAGHKGRAPKPKREAVQLEGLLNIMAVLEAAEAGEAGSAAAADAPSSSTQRLRPCRASRPLQDTTLASLVDALYDRLDVLKEWKVLAGALMEEGPLADGRSSADLINLAGVLAASAARTAAPPKAGKLGPRKAGGAAAEGARQEMTGVLMRVLPGALQRHAAEASVVAHLAACVPSMQLELYSLGEEGDTLEALLKLLAAAFFRHGELHLLQRCAAAITHAVETGPKSLQDRAQVVWKSCQQGTVTRLGAALRTAAALSDKDLAVEVEELGREAASSSSSSALFSLHLALQRLHTVLVAPCGQELLSQPAALSALDQLLGGAAQGRCLGPLLAPLAASCAFTLLCWSLTEAYTGTPSPPAIADLAARRDSFLADACATFDALQDDDARDRLFKMMADVLFLFGKGRWAGTSLEGAAVDPPRDVLQRCWQQCLHILECHPAAPLEEEEGDEEGEAARQGAVEAADRARVKAEAVAALGRLILHRAAGQHYQWLALHVVSLMVGHGDAVTDVVKEVVAGIRKERPAVLPEAFLGALQLRYDDYLEAGPQQAGEADGEEEEEEEGTGKGRALQLLGQLGTQISHQYIGAGSAAAKAAVLSIVKGGLTYALQAIPSRALFLPYALGPLTVRLSPEDAAAVAEELEQRSEELRQQQQQQGEDSDNEEAAAWSGLEMYMQGLQERAAKGKLLKSALKAGRRQEPTPRRRISFAAGRAEPGAHQHPQEEDEEVEQEEEEEEEAEEEQQEQARQEEVKRGRNRRPAAQQPPQQDGRSTASERTDGQQAAAPRRGGRSTMKAVDTDAGPLGSLPSSGLEQAPSGGSGLLGELAASDEEGGSAGSGQGQGSDEGGEEEVTEGSEEGGDEAERGEGELEGEGEEEEMDEMDMMPTEEELPGRQQHGAMDLPGEQAESSEEEGRAAGAAPEEQDEPPPRARRRRRL